MGDVEVAANRVAPAEHRFTLADGRALAWREVGDPEGRPVINCHGGLICGLDVVPAHDAALAAGLRIVSPDRPGIGHSGLLAGRCTGDWAADAAELADHLGLERFGVMGWSLGGQYALAVAAGLADRVDTTVVIAGAPPLGGEARYRELSPTDRYLTGLSVNRPRRGRVVFGAMAAAARRAPRTTTRIAARGLAPPEAAALRALPAGEFADWLALALAQPEGMVEEYVAWTRPWRFAMSDVSCPTHLWQGTLDTLVPARWVDVLAAEIPDAEVHLVEGEGHFVAHSRWAEVLAPLSG